MKFQNKHFANLFIGKNSLHPPYFINFIGILFGLQLRESLIFSLTLTMLFTMLQYLYTNHGDQNIINDLIRSFCYTPLQMCENQSYLFI